MLLPWAPAQKRHHSTKKDTPTWHMQRPMTAYPWMTCVTGSNMPVCTRLNRLLETHHHKVLDMLMKGHRQWTSRFYVADRLCCLTNP